MLVLRAACPDHAVSFAQLGGGWEGGKGGRDIDAVTSSQTSAPSALHKGEGRREGGRNIASPPPPSAPKGKETKAAFKQRLRRAAMATSTDACSKPAKTDRKTQVLARVTPTPRTECPQFS